MPSQSFLSDGFANSALIDDLVFKYRGVSCPASELLEGVF